MRMCGGLGLGMLAMLIGCEGLEMRGPRRPPPTLTCIEHLGECLNTPLGSIQGSYGQSVCVDCYDLAARIPLGRGHISRARSEAAGGGSIRAGSCLLMRHQQRMSTMPNEARAALSEALRAADQLLSRHIREKQHEDETTCAAAYCELMACLDACSAMPDSAQVAPGIAQRRLVATTIYKRTDDECERALQELLSTEPELMRRAMSTLSSCRERPKLLAKYLPALIDELEAAVADDPSLMQPLVYARQDRETLARIGLLPST